MGVLDWFESWFKSNKETFTAEQQKRIEDMLRKMETQMYDQLNRSVSQQHNRTTEFVQRETMKLRDNLVDTEDFLLRQMKDMKEQMEKLKEEMENEKKKGKEKETEKEEGKKTKPDEIDDIIKRFVSAVTLEMNISGFPNVGPSNQGPGVWSPGHTPNPYRPGPSSYSPGPGPDWNGPGPSWNGPGPSWSSPGPSWNGPGPSYNGPGPSYNGPGTSYNGPGSSYNGPGPSWNGPGPHWNGSHPSSNKPGSNMSAPDARNNHTRSSHSNESVCGRICTSNNHLENVIFPDERDYVKNGKEWDNHGKRGNESSHPENNSLLGQHNRRKFGENRNESGDVREQCPPEKVILPDKRDYRKYGQKFEETVRNNKREGSHPKPKSVSEQSRKTFGKGDLILPDLRDYERRNIGRKGNEEDEEKSFKTILDNFFGNYSPQNTSSNDSDQYKEKIASNVHNYFANNPSKNSRRSSVKSAGSRREDPRNTSNPVEDWLKDSETYSQKNDDGFESDSSATSVKTTGSAISQMSVSSHVSTASGKRVFWNKKKVGQHQPKNNYDGRQEIKSNDGSKSSGYGGSQYKNRKYNANNKKLLPNCGKKEGQENDVQNAGQLNNNRNYEFKKKFKENQRNQRTVENKNKNNHVTNADRSVDVVKEAPCTSPGKQNEVDGLKKIQYPSEEEARKKNLDLNKPLDVKVMLVGKKDGKLMSEIPECLADIYRFEKMFDSFEVITM